MTNRTVLKQRPAGLFSLVLAVLVLIPVGPSLFPATADGLEDRDCLVLDVVERKRAAGDATIDLDLFPGLSRGIALLPEPPPDTGDFHYRLIKISANRLAEMKQRLALLKHSPLYAISKTRYFGRSPTQPVYLNQAFFTRTLSITESRCHCIKTFPFEVFGCPPDTPLGYGCFFDYDRPEHLHDAWPPGAQSRPGDRGTIKAPIYWGYDLCQADVLEITVECSIELSRGGAPIGPVNYGATPIAVRTADHLYLVRQVPGLFPREIKDCGMETQTVIHGFPIGEVDDAGDMDLLNLIKTDTLNHLIQGFSAPPINADLEVALSDEAILIRSGQKSALMAEQFESAGYVVRVYSENGTIYVAVRYHVLACASPDGPFHPLSKEETDHYIQAMQAAVAAARERIMATYGDRMATRLDRQAGQTD